MNAPRVLIVDDNVDLAENLCEILEAEGCTCALAEDGEAALACLEDEAFDVVITDLKMEGMSGLDLLREVGERWPQTAVIIVTAYAREPTVATARQEGAIDVLPKPIDLPSLLGTVRRLLESEGQVLLVEDEADLRDNLVEILQRCTKLTPVAVGTIQDALAALTRQQFSVAIIDMRLPDGHGVHLATALQRLPHHERPTLVFTSAYPDEIGSILESVSADRPPKILTKPFSPAALVSIVRKAV